jgi:uncharacterized protein YjbI with pentapeptide repeats
VRNVRAIAATTDTRLILGGQTIAISRLGNILPINAFYSDRSHFPGGLVRSFSILLLRLWSTMTELPAVFPDGQTVERGGPWYLMGLVRRHFRWLRETKTPVSWMETTIATLLAYWAVPATIVLLWVRYLVRQDMRGTSAARALFRSGSERRHRAALCCEPGDPQRRSAASNFAQRGAIGAPDVTRPNRRRCNPICTFLRRDTGVPADSEASQRYFQRQSPALGRRSLRLVGYRPYADLIEATLVPPRARTASANDAPEAGAGAKLNEYSLRYARGYRAVLGGARLWRADLVGAYLTEADLRNANLREAHLRDAVLDHARADHVLLISADGSDANLTGADLRSSDMTYANFDNASFAGARLGAASLYGAKLRHTNWLRADLSRSDMRDTQLQEADFSLANLELTDFSGAKLAGAQFTGAQFKGTILLGADLRNAGLRGATFAGAVLRDAPMDGAQLDGADFRGSLGLAAAQVCSSRGWATAQFDADVLQAVQSLCGSAR